MIYFIQRKSDGLIKIGTTMNPKDRLKTLMRKNGEFDVLGVMDGQEKEERAIHQMFGEFRVGNPGSEWFKSSSSILEFITKNSRASSFSELDSNESWVEYSTTRIWDETTQTLRFIKAYTGENIVSIVDRLAREELKRVETLAQEQNNKTPGQRRQR